MTTTVAMQKDDGDVALTITFDGKVDWSYRYAFEGGHCRGKSTDGGGPSRTHPLGSPAALHLDAHDWDIGVASGSDRDEAVTVTMEWKQERGAAPIHRRVYATTLKPGNPGEPFRDGIFLVQAP